MLREWSRSNFRPGLTTLCGGRRLSAEPLSYRYFVARTITTTPVQSAMAFPKNDPRCVLGLETLYSPIHNRSTATEAMLSEWRRKKLCCRDICEDSYPRQGDQQLSTHLQRSAAIFGLTTIWRLRLVRQIDPIQQVSQATRTHRPIQFIFGPERRLCAVEHCGDFCGDLLYISTNFGTS